MKFRNDITPADFMFMGNELYWLICYAKEKPHKPFVVEVIDTDKLGWYRGTAYEANENGQFLYEWPENWFWAEWIKPKIIGDRLIG